MLSWINFWSTSDNTASDSFSRTHVEVIHVDAQKLLAAKESLNKIGTIGLESEEWQEIDNQTTEAKSAKDLQEEGLLGPARFAPNQGIDIINTLNANRWRIVSVTVEELAQLKSSLKPVPVREDKDNEEINIASEISAVYKQGFQNYFKEYRANHGLDKNHDLTKNKREFVPVLDTDSDSDSEYKQETGSVIYYSSEEEYNQEYQDINKLIEEALHELNEMNPEEQSDEDWSDDNDWNEETWNYMNMYYKNRYMDELCSTF